MKRLISLAALLLCAAGCALSAEPEPDPEPVVENETEQSPDAVSSSPAMPVTTGALDLVVAESPTDPAKPTPDPWNGVTKPTPDPWAPDEPSEEGAEDSAESCTEASSNTQAALPHAAQ